MSNTLSLATRLRGFSDDELSQLIESRRLKTSGIHDFFDLADALLDPGSVQHALVQLNRHTLAVLAALAALRTEHAASEFSTQAVADRIAVAAGPRPAGEPDRGAAAVNAAAKLASAHALLDIEGDRLVLYDAVAEQLRTWPGSGLPSLDDLAQQSPPAGPEQRPGSTASDQHAADRAFETISKSTEMLIEIEREPARRLAKGGIALPDAKRLGFAMGVEPEQVATFLRLTRRAGLLQRESGSWLITDEGATWLHEPSGRRWRDLAVAWGDQLPAGVRPFLANREAASKASLSDQVHWLYPAGGEALADRVAGYLLDADLIGVVSGDQFSGPGQLVMVGDLDAAEDAMTSRFPPEVDRVYLQRDLTIIAPGPLKPGIDARLRTLADVESRQLASSYRISTSSINRAMAAGETTDSLLAFLAEISLTGIPQPVDYLIGETANRYGLVRVGRARHLSSSPTIDAARSYVRSADRALLDAIMVDQNLAVLELAVVDETTAVSHLEVDVVFFTLSDARYPVAVEDESGQPVALQRRRTASRPHPADNTAQALVQKLRHSVHAESDTSQVWLIRQLDIAIKNKFALIVSVKMPNGSVIERQLEPTSVSGGRLRSHDRRSAIERTVPLASIVGLKPVRDHRN